MQLTKKKGFTLIEIVIVLAIAALILIIVFLAVAGAQRARRDTQRKTDLDKIAAQLENWASNHNSDYPLDTQWSGFATGATSYLKLDQPAAQRTMADPGGAAYTTAAGGAIGNCAVSPGGGGAAANQIPTATTPGAGIAYHTTAAATPVRNFTVRICLEAGDYQRTQ